MANEPAAGAYGNEETVVVITLDKFNWLLDKPATIGPVTVPELPVAIVALFKALEEIEKTGPLSALVVVMVVDVSADTLWTSPIAPGAEVVAVCEEDAGEGVTRS